MHHFQLEKRDKIETVVNRTSEKLNTLAGFGNLLSPPNNTNFDFYAFKVSLVVGKPFGKIGKVRSTFRWYSIFGQQFALK